MIDLSQPCVLNISFASLLKRLEFNTPMGWITQPTFNINLPYPVDLKTIGVYIEQTMQKVEAVPLANDAAYQEMANLANERLEKMALEFDREELVKNLEAQMELELKSLRLIYEVDVNRTGMIISIEIASRDDLEE